MYGEDVAAYKIQLFASRPQLMACEFVYLSLG